MKSIMFILAAAATLTLAGCDIEVDAQAPPTDYSHLSFCETSRG